MRRNNRTATHVLIAASVLAMFLSPSPARAELWRKWVGGQVDCVIPNPWTYYPYIRVFQLHTRVQWDYDTTKKVISNVQHTMWFTNVNTGLFRDLGSEPTAPDQYFAWKAGYPKSGYSTTRRRQVAIGPVQGPLNGVTTWHPQSHFDLHSDGSEVHSLKCR